MLFYTPKAVFDQLMKYCLVVNLLQFNTRNIINQLEFIMNYTPSF
jgi:hypothetical protein